MNSTFNISVIIPAYNAERYLRRSLESVFKQSFKPLEVIIVDDGSKDKTENIAQSYIDRITFIQQKNGGAAAARNTGIKAAHGEWIAFLDVDDEWRCHHLENAVKILGTYPELKWYGASVNQYINESGRLLAKYKKKKSGILIDNAYFDDYMLAFPPYAHFATPTMIIHRSVFNKTGLFAENLRTGQDLDMWYRIGLQFPKVGYSHEIAANIYKRSTSLSYTKKHDYTKSLTTFKEMERLAESLGKKTRLRAEPRIMNMVTKLLKASLSRGNTTAINDILMIYSQRLSPRWLWLARVYLAFPWVIRPAFILRNTINQGSKRVKQNDK